MRAFKMVLTMSSTILVVEDEPAIQELIAVNLSFAGHKVLRAFDVAQAETLIRAELPDLILLDWMLPGASGLTLARKLRSDERQRTQNIEQVLPEVVFGLQVQLFFGCVIKPSDLQGGVQDDHADRQGLAGSHCACAGFFKLLNGGNLIAKTAIQGCDNVIPGTHVCGRLVIGRN